MYSYSTEYSTVRVRREQYIHVLGVIDDSAVIKILKHTINVLEYVQYLNAVSVFQIPMFPPIFLKFVETPEEDWKNIKYSCTVQVHEGIL
jgi:hypothetical protein